MRKLFPPALLLLSLLFIGMNIYAQISSNTAVSHSLPFSFTAFGNSYSITGYKIDKDENGKITLTLFGQGYDIVPFRNGKISMPAWGSIEINGKEIDPLSCQASKESLKYNFNSTSQPDKIIVRHGDTDDVILSFNIKDIPQTK